MLIITGMLFSAAWSHQFHDFRPGLPGRGRQEVSSSASNRPDAASGARDAHAGADRRELIPRAAIGETAARRAAAAQRLSGCRHIGEACGATLSTRTYVAEAAQVHVLHDGQAARPGCTPGTPCRCAGVTSAQRLTGFPRSLPSKQNPPEVGLTRRLMQRISVDLPVPEGDDGGDAIGAFDVRGDVARHRLAGDIFLDQVFDGRCSWVCAGEGRSGRRMIRNVAGARNRQRQAPVIGRLRVSCDAISSSPRAAATSRSVLHVRSLCRNLTPPAAATSTHLTTSSEDRGRRQRRRRIFCWGESIVVEAGKCLVGQLRFQIGGRSSDGNFCCGRSRHLPRHAQPRRTSARGKGRPGRRRVALLQCPGSMKSCLPE